MTRTSPPPTPTMAEEQALAAQGFRTIVGVDEVGRGPLAGPVMAGAVALPLDWLTTPPWESPAPWLGQVRDSKALSPTQRAALYPALLRETRWGTGIASSEEVDALGIVEATRLAMLRALAALPVTPEHVLLDGRPVKLGGLPCKAIVGGDASCLSIAAASILAKVARDALMEQGEERYPGYGFARNKGYGTAGHLEALRRLGPSPIHRHTFAPVRALLEATQGPPHHSRREPLFGERGVPTPSQERVSPPGWGAVPRWLLHTPGQGGPRG